MKYIYPLELNINFDIIRSLIMEEILKMPPTGLLYHQRFIDNKPYLIEIQRKYPILSNSFNIYYLSGGKKIEPHIDSDRFVALNIPIRGVKGTATIFYSSPSYLETHNKSYIYDAINGDLKEEFRFCLDTPTLLNTKHIHSVDNPNNKTRIVMSWNIISGYSYEDAVEWFKSYQDTTQQNNL
jgi:hypothetical protein